MIGLYLPKDTLIHKLQPGVKLIFLTVYGTSIFWVSSMSVLLLFLLLVVLLYKMAEIPFHHVVKQIKPVCPFLVLVFVFQAIFDNWLTGFWIISRFILLISLASLVSLTTKVSDMVHSIETGLRPFQYYGVNSSKLGMVLSMAIRFIPVVSEKFNEIREAQKARGLDTNIMALAMPLIIRTIKMASEVAEALDARSYDSDIDKLPSDNKNSHTEGIIE
ncbi:energy-coupling factor transporter transmembrane component T family protein [Bartonella bacilliformis]|uniref:energy-coupling factor transporter transmembrane component T family protein n=1 Tax=Bartonella bacilliformis TaxID=774 RepID=UPI0004A15D0F|nr:energy-coupling factor transporter transmembrane protein EcfT [Bartonella bacilliformis]KEG15683.1 hypothetical protein H705_01111 [Bartonella bacilliformis Cond044]